ncbi:hypothetical protein GE115_05805 [Agromyces sp. CFH 90414]|uniref:Uncharacterized protein n=1 Tax=Agromyces agglutinans TaxID=2662258 RepID=A0A6I2FE66_9MICO|nr:hypothetical protein [Agromyces agglutinans]MRG59388.1 hypothetical protein [Agromyces agglutinans]
MFISEYAFPHLVADHDARLERELEHRRVAAERREERAVAEVPEGSHARRSRRASHRAASMHRARPA